MSTRTVLLLSALALAGAAAFWAADVNLPPPYATPSANNRPKVIPRPDGAQLRVPAGFNVDVFAEGFEVPRFMVLGPSKELLVSDAARDGNAPSTCSREKSGRNSSAGSTGHSASRSGTNICTRASR